MKRIFLSAAIMSALVSCNKNEPTPTGETKEAYINATSGTKWHYYSFAQAKVIDSAEEASNAAWQARTDWDVAIRRYNIRTNSGAFTTADAKGGVYTLDAAATFESVTKVPDAAVFVGDTSITSEGMGGSTTVICSDAQVIILKVNEDGSLVMPPVYLPAPVYIFRTADGNNYYKVQFTNYVNDDGKTGHVEFKAAKIGL
jgi:hypothetical protein